MFDTLIEYYVRLLRLLVSSYWGGFLLIIVAIYGIIYMYKERNDEINQGSGMYYLGWVGAIGMIILGVSVIIFKLLGKV